MLEAIRHRGPDDEGICCLPGAVLGHRRLSIIDLSGGRQPIANEDGSLHIICNGEIYNYVELRAGLEAKGHTFSTRSDNEVILHLFEEDGAACVQQLRGMFAFAIWDSARQQLFAARDRLGQKPFYYAVHRGELLFASEIKGILAAAPELAELDPEALDQYLSLRIIAPPRSMFAGIRKLPPAHVLRYSSASGVEVQRYWDLEFLPKFTEPHEDLVEELERRMVECLRVHMVSDVPVGAFLSGGLDSTLIAGMTVRHVTKRGIPTFSVGLPYREFDEAPSARKVANAYETEHHEWTLTPSLLETLPALLWHLDEPSDPLAVCLYLIAERTSEHVKVVLGGDGGDELFGGYDRYYGFGYASQYARIPLAVRKAILGPLIHTLPSGGWYRSKGHQARWLHRASLAQGGDRYVQMLSYFYFDRERRRRLYGPRFGGAADDFDPGACLRDPFEHANANSDVDRMLHADCQVRLPDHPAMILDRMTMAHGLEARSPFMDHELAEFAARLPVSSKIQGRRTRVIQRDLAERYLPEDLMRRRKQGFSSALPYMLREEYRLLFRHFLDDAHLVREGYLQGAEIDRLLRDHLAGRGDHGNRLWLLLNAEMWYRMFIEGTERTELESQLRSLRAHSSA